jgi:hypothetical protein
MCGGGGKGSGGYTPQGSQWGNLTPSQQQTTTASPEAISWYQQAMKQAQQAAAQPFQQFGTKPEDFVAQLNAQQQAAQQGIAGQAAATQPFAQMGAGMQAAAGMGNAAQMAGAYMNPFMQQVVSPVQQALQQQQGQQLSQQQAEAIKAGAFGGERAGLQRQLLRGQQELGMGQALSPLYQTGYGQALGAAQTDLQRQLAAGQGLTQAGLAAQQASLGAGTLGQQTQQAGINALYNQFQQQRAYPFQTAQFLAGIAGGLGPLMGQMNYQSQATNPFGMFLARGGAAKSRMGGAVNEAGDYSEGGVVGRNAYKLRGSVSADEDMPSLLASQEQMYGDQAKGDAQDVIPTGGIQTGKSLETAKFEQPQQQKSIADKIKALTGAAKDVVGTGKEVYGLGKGAYDWLSGPSFASEVGGMGANAAADAAGGTGFLDAIGSGLSGLGSSIVSGLETLGPALAFFQDGGRVGYADRGFVDGEDFDPIFERGVIGAESAGKQFDRYGRPLTSPKGAIGIAQVMPGTAPEAARLANLPFDPEKYRNDETYNKALGRAYYNEQLRKFGTPELALAAYNAGPGRVAQAVKRAGPSGDVMSLLPKETQAYVPRAMGLAGLNTNDIISQAKKLDRGYMAKADLPAEGSTVNLRPSAGVRPSEDEEGFGLNKQTIFPVLTGLGAALEGMVESPTVGIGGALLRGAGKGLGAGVKSYMDIAKQFPEIEKIKAETGRIGAETGRIGAETGRIGAEQRGIDIENFQKSIKDTPYGRVVSWLNGLPINMSEYRDRVERGERVPLLGGLPADAEERANRAFKEPGSSTGDQVVTQPETTQGKKTSVKTPEEKITASPGVVYDEKSRERARREQDVVMNGGPQAELAKKRSETYNDMVTNEANGARENAPYMKELATTLAGSYTKGGLDTPGFKSELRAEVINAANTFYHMLGGTGDLGTLKRDQDIVNKISTLLSSERARAGNQHAYAALETMKNAIPNLSMDPRAGAELTAQLMVLQQRALDRDEHMKKYAKDSNGYLSEAPNDFTEKSSSRYQMESKIMSDLMLHRAGALKMMMSGHGVSPEQIEEKLKKWYGKDTPDDMWRYFAPERH